MADDLQGRILIADDREENRYLMGRVLRAAGYDCAEAGTGAKAIHMAAAQPALIILDVHLPDMSGFEVCRKIKSNPATASIPILQISASFVSPEDRVKALEGGADGYLTHPIDRMVLVATVRALLRMRHAEAVARGAAERWEAAFNGLVEGLAILDAENHLLRWNAAFAHHCAEEFELSIGQDLSAFLTARLGVGALTSLQTNQHFKADFESGGRTFEVSGSTVETEPGRVEKFLVFSDVTDRKLAEFAVRTAERLAATGRLANAIAHEINNPLEALTNLVYLAQASGEMAEIRDLLTRAEGELERIARITKQSLAFHRDTASPTVLDPEQLLAEVVDIYQPAFASRRVRLIFDPRPAPPVRGFPGQLRQVFGNLVRNAMEASPAQTEVVVRVRAVQRQGRRGVRVMIHDHGPGIAANVKDKLFDPFFTTKDLKGSGLGLWVSKRLIGEHQGTIRFRSTDREGRNGTTFEVFLPADPFTGPASVSKRRSSKSGANAPVAPAPQSASMAPL